MEIISGVTKTDRLKGALVDPKKKEAEKKS
jgi:hypothetical protein